MWINMRQCVRTTSTKYKCLRKINSTFKKLFRKRKVKLSRKMLKSRPMKTGRILWESNLRKRLKKSIKKDSPLLHPKIYRCKKQTKKTELYQTTWNKKKSKWGEYQLNSKQQKDHRLISNTKPVNLKRKTTVWKEATNQRYNSLKESRYKIEIIAKIWAIDNGIWRDK